MSIVMSWIISHLLAELEEILIEEEPAIISELEVLVKKLENYIASKSSIAAEILNPILDMASDIVSNEFPVVVHTIADELETM